MLSGVTLAWALAAVAGAQDAAPAAGDVPTSPETNPAVLSALELPRTKPGDYLQAVMCLVDLGRPELAAPIFKELEALQLTAAQRAELVTEYGSYRMLQLARTKQLPGGAAFAESCLAAAAAQARNPQRLASLIDALFDPSPEARLLARADLAHTGRDGAVAVLEALAREQDPQRRAALAKAAAAMYPLVVGPLVAMLDTHDAALRSEVVSLLSQLGVTQAAPLVASSASAERALKVAIRDYQHGAQPFASDGTGQIELWLWDDADGKLSSAKYSIADVRSIWIARLALRLTELAPDNRAYHRQALLYNLEAVTIQSPHLGNCTSPADQLAAGADVAMLDDVLSDALKLDLAGAAVAAADLLAERSDASVLVTADARPSPLARALTDPHRRVRFAALRAIIALDPERPFPGSSRVPAALGYFAGATGRRGAVAAMPTAVRATALAGQLAAAGIEAKAVDTGFATVQAAVGMADLEMIFIDMDISGPGAREVVYQLRAAPTTALVPIALLAGDGARLVAAQQLADAHRRVIAAARPGSEQELQAIVARLEKLAGRDATTPGQRADEATQAITWLARLLDSDHSFYQLGRQAPVIEGSLYRLEASPSVLAALVALGTPTSQQTLVDYASQSTVPIDGRLRAAQAFRASVDQHGLLLAHDDILRQYDRYNASAKADAATQQVLGSILDAIESRRQTPPLPLGEGRVAPGDSPWRGEGASSARPPGKRPR